MFFLAAVYRKQATLVSRVAQLEKRSAGLGQTPVRGSGGVAAEALVSLPKQPLFDDVADFVSMTNMPHNLVSYY